jgi:hypothetical protein
MNTCEIQPVPQAASSITNAPKKKAKKTKFMGYNWSKTKLVARKISAEEYRQQEAQNKKDREKNKKRHKRLRESELKKAKKLLGSDFTETLRRSARGTPSTQQ